MIPGYLFLIHLHNSLIPNQLIGNYNFIKWLRNGNLQFRINANQTKSIPPELIMLAYHIHFRNTRIQQPVNINQQWLCANGHSDWCFVEVINFLLNDYSHNL
jgi:hypothetical protein